MVLQHWDPMYELRRMREAMDRRWCGPVFATGSTERKEWAIPVDVVEEAEEILVQASVPGVKPEDIDQMHTEAKQYWGKLGSYVGKLFDAADPPLRSVLSPVCLDRAPLTSC